LSAAIERQPRSALQNNLLEALVFHSRRFRTYQTRKRRDQ
jgi:hypothetical protein